MPLVGISEFYYPCEQVICKFGPKPTKIHAYNSYIHVKYHMSNTTSIVSSYQHRNRLNGELTLLPKQTSIPINIL